MPDPTEAADDAARELYAVAPDEFLAKRAELAARLRADGEAAAARTVDKLRKPTAAAWIVNAFVLDEPAVVDELTDLGRRLRDAQDGLDAAQLRELSTERRRLVARLGNDAFRRAGRAQPAAALRDEVTGTFDAAIADPEVAGRLGQLQRPEKWSGFGFLPTGAPELTLVRGGKGAPAPARKPAVPKISAAEKRRQQRALASARTAFEGAQSAFDDARQHEQDLSQEVRRLTKKLAKVQAQLDTARAELETARKDVTSSRGARREARSALDRAEREAGD